MFCPPLKSEALRYYHGDCSEFKKGIKVRNLSLYGWNKVRVCLEYLELKQNLKDVSPRATNPRLYDAMKRHFGGYEAFKLFFGRQEPQIKAFLIEYST
jgi:hypothetical protein